jgi:hypothetical protein
MSDEIIKRARHIAEYNKAAPGKFIMQMAAHIESLEAEIARLRDDDINAVVTVAAMARAMNDLLNAPKGVVPDSALPWYDGKAGRFYGLQITGSKAEFPARAALDKDTKR